MSYFAELGPAIAANWPVWFVTITLIVAAVIDGFELKVPNWLTYPMIVSGWIFSAVAASYGGVEWLEGLTWYQALGYSFLGTLVGFLLLWPPYAIGGMGAGDVKLLMGLGAWMHTSTTLYSFALGAVIGGFIAIGMIIYKNSAKKHAVQAGGILREIVSVKNPITLSEIAKERKPRMLLLPYGIPLTIGAILYFAFTGLLLP